MVCLTSILLLSFTAAFTHAELYTATWKTPARIEKFVGQALPPDPVAGAIMNATLVSSDGKSTTGWLCYAKGEKWYFYQTKAHKDVAIDPSYAMAWVFGKYDEKKEFTGSAGWDLPADVDWNTLIIGYESTKTLVKQQGLLFLNMTVTLAKDKKNKDKLDMLWCQKLPEVNGDWPYGTTEKPQTRGSVCSLNQFSFGEDEPDAKGQQGQ